MSGTLADLRTRIDAIDRQLLSLLQERQAAAEAIGTLKRGTGAQIVQPARARELFNARRAAGEELGLDPGYVEAIWRLIHEESCRVQAALLNTQP